ncbi:MAG: hypothetical protein K0R51_3222, partial [Cytophagaceae bacterium]|nr:hypothetical protein [Cytophagaceae bacterium]
MKTKLFLLFVSLVLTLSCSEKENATVEDDLQAIDSVATVPQKFPEVKPIESLPNTEFVLALEQPFNAYKNDDEFIVRLTPKDTSQEIILVKGDRNSKNF